MCSTSTYASDRRAAIERAVDMINSRRNSWKSNPPSEREIRLMSKLRDKGMSFGEIGEELFDRYGYTLDPCDIQRIIRRNQDSND